MASLLDIMCVGNEGIVSAGNTCRDVSSWKAMLRELKDKVREEGSKGSSQVKTNWVQPDSKAGTV